MKQMEQHVQRECLTLDFVKYWLGYMNVAYGINYALF